jgi:hypothetical protein
MTSDWRAPVNQLLYSLTYSENIDASTVDFNAESAVRFTTLTLGPEVYYWAINQALSSGEPLDVIPLLPQFDQREIADFLRAVAGRLDQMRPWPEPDVRPLDTAAWAEFADAVKVAELDASLVEVTDALQHGFVPVPGAEPGAQVMILRLRSGETVVLLGAYGVDKKVSLLVEPSAVHTDVIAHFIALTGFPAEKVISK